MVKKLLQYMIIASVVFTGCSFHLNSPVVDKSLLQAHLFETTPTSAGSKSEQDLAEPKVIATSINSPAYPTPFPTYLVPSRLITVTYGPTTVPTGATPTQVQPTVILPTNTPTRVGPTPTSTLVPPTAIPPTQFSYGVQPGSPAFVPNFTNATAGCAWQGIAGQVFNASGLPVINVVVKAGGTWNGTTSTLLGMGMTGASTLYGEGGYEVVLGTKAVNSTNTVWIQTYDLAGKALSDKVYISTYSDCSKNLTLVNFKEAAEGMNIFIPMVIQTTTP
jgi:hypothetical protein